MLPRKRVVADEPQNAFTPTNRDSGEARKRNDGKLMYLTKKVYTPKDSVLTSMMNINHLQSLYNLTVAIFIMTFIITLLYYMAAPKIFKKDLEIVLWACSNFQLFLKMWPCFNAYAFTVFFAFKLWISVRSKSHAKFVDTIFLLSYICSLFAMFALTVTVLLGNVFRPLTNFAIMCEQIRIFMKIYSFVKENVPRVLQLKSTDSSETGQYTVPTFMHYLYFLFIPAFIYRDSYPRNLKRNWRFLSHHVFKFFAAIFVENFIVMRYIVDVFGETGIRPYTLAELAGLYATATFAGVVMMFLLFYSILHSWLNIFAELLLFADREFYQDWWNSSSFTHYYRKWNLVVSDWLHAYVYAELVTMGLGRSSSLAVVSVFSALMHEYVIAMTAGFWFPILMFAYLSNIPIILWTMKKTGQGWNIAMWCMWMSGLGLVTMFIAIEWYARTNCPGSNDPYKNFFQPRLWTELGRIISLNELE